MNPSDFVDTSSFRALQFCAADANKLPGIGFVTDAPISVKIEGSIGVVKRTEEFCLGGRL